jgi:hypothetical protein
MSPIFGWNNPSNSDTGLKDTDRAKVPRGPAGSL